MKCSNLSYEPICTNKQNTTMFNFCYSNWARLSYDPIFPFVFKIGGSFSLKFFEKSKNEGKKRSS